MTCTCPEHPSGPWDCVDCPEHGEEAEHAMAEEARFEIEAENAWLRAAEMGTPEDYAFERYEAEMGLL